MTATHRNTSDTTKIIAAALLRMGLRDEKICLGDLADETEKAKLVAYGFASHLALRDGRFCGYLAQKFGV